MDADKIYWILIHGGMNAPRAKIASQEIYNNLTKELQEAREELDLCAAREAESENYVKELQKEIAELKETKDQELRLYESQNQTILKLQSQLASREEEVSELESVFNYCQSQMNDMKEKVKILETCNGGIIELKDQAIKKVEWDLQLMRERAEQYESLFEAQKELKKIARRERNSYKESCKNLEEEVKRLREVVEAVVSYQTNKISAPMLYKMARKALNP